MMMMMLMDDVVAAIILMTMLSLSPPVMIDCYCYCCQNFCY